MKPPDADAGDELGDEAEGLGKRLPAGPPIAHFRRRAARFNHFQPFSD